MLAFGTFNIILHPRNLIQKCISYCHSKAHFSTLAGVFTCIPRFFSKMSTFNHIMLSFKKYEFMRISDLIF